MRTEYNYPFLSFGDTDFIKYGYNIQFCKIPYFRNTIQGFLN